MAGVRCDCRIDLRKTVFHSKSGRTWPRARWTPRKSTVRY